MMHYNLLNIVLFLIIVNQYSTANLDTFLKNLKVEVINPVKTVLPARYFFIYYGEMPLTKNDLKLKITGKNFNQQDCRLRYEILPTNHNYFIVRYRIEETCYNFAILLNIFYKGQNVATPLQVSEKNYVQPEECYCPVKIFEEWRNNFGCPNKYHQINSDLSRFNYVDFNIVYENGVKKFNNSRSSSVCHYVVKDNEIYRTCFGQHTDFKIFMDDILLSLTRKFKLDDMEFFTNLGDWPLIKKQENFPLFSWCGSDDTNDIVLPSYDITESTLQNMNRVTLDMLSVQGNIDLKWNDKLEQAFWRGRDSSLERLKLIELSRKYPEILNASITNFFFFNDQQDIYGPAEKYISFFKFFNYKYQINMDGTVAAYRFPYLLAGNSVVFKQDSPYYEFFYKSLKPWVHYIPFKSDLSNLIDMVQWAKQNDELAHKIAENGHNFALRNLMPKDIFCYQAILFSEWSKKLKNDIIIRNGMEKVERSSTKQFLCACQDDFHDEL